jgi:hemoglobin
VSTLYDEVGGFDAIMTLCRTWTDLCLADPVAAHPFERDIHPRHDERLAAYLAEALGGPALYTSGYGDESSMQRIHAGHGVHIELDELCLEMFDRALVRTGITGTAGERLSAYFRAATELQRKYSDDVDEVPDGLPLFYA